MSARQFDQFRASSLFCASCGKAQPVREKLLLVLPDKELFNYLCVVCGNVVGQREVTATDKLMHDALAARRSARRQVRIL
jgi:predicted nucleic acid-binding Zn ribbon protein